MMISESVFKENVTFDAPYHLASIQNFKSLIPISQKLSKPMYELKQNDKPWSGAYLGKRK